MKKDRTLLYGALALIGVAIFIQYQKKKQRELDEEFDNIGGARKFCNANNNFGMTGRECRRHYRRNDWNL
jgi:hypothetical protein